MQRFSKVFTLMSAIIALAFCAVACKTDDDDPTMYTVTVSSSIEHGKVSVDKTSAEAGETIKLTATADNGYELDSYSVKDASANELTVTDGTFTMPKSNVTVSATFTALPPATASYTVKHLQQNIADNNYTLKESETKTGTVGQPTEASAKSYEGFTAQTVTQVTVAASGTEVEIKYNRNTYTVTFDSNGGSDVSSQSLRYEAKATEPADPTKTATTTTKYTFDAWYSDSGLTTPFSFDTAIKKDITLYAKWTETAVTPQKTAGSISYDTTSVEKTTADGTFTNTLTNTGDGAVTYSSSKTAVAEVNTQNGLVTIKGAGETTITATVADSDNYTYATKTASYTLTVTEASPLNLNLKTGAAIHSILVQLCKGSGVYPACTKFARSATNNDKATLYLDTEEKYIPVWSVDTEVYYYVPDGCTPVMNEDSSGMFAYCSKLTSLEVTGFDTSKVTNMSCMFLQCSGLTSLDVTGFDTSNVTNMSVMFANCSKLTGLDVTGFNTRKVTNMLDMFSNCSGLTSLDVSKFYTSKVENMSGMFARCSGLTSLDVDDFNTSKVTNMSSMFLHCSGLTSLDVTGFDTSIVTDMSVMFAGCSGLTNLDLSKFVTSNVQDMEEMFSGCEGLKTIYATDKFVTTNVTSGDNCFDQCSKLVGGAGTTYDSSRTSADYARIDGGPDSASPGYFTLKPIGSKSKPDAVGDIVFTDGSATPYSADLTLTEEQKAAAIALIFYKGTGLNSGDDITTSRTLGVGLKHNTSGLAWCSRSAAAVGANITTIQCPASESAGAWTFTGDTNGSDNLKQISDFLISLSETDDTGTAENYPAFYFGKNYKDTATNIAGTDYESGWYLPSIAELFQIYACRADTAKGFDIDAASEALGGDKFDYYNYWSSSQDASDEMCAYTFNFDGGGCFADFKENVHDIIRVCAVRAFN